MKECLYRETRISSGKPNSIRTCLRKADRERMTIGHFLADGFGMRILCGMYFVEKSSEAARNNMFIFVLFHEMLLRLDPKFIFGSGCVYLHECCPSNPSRHLPGPNTPVNKNADFGVSGNGYVGR